ncbi:MAG: TerB N-terminal domain-containing protein, partial [Proteobacteria bacterium]|nr:TerB N-terminal domain-containing protein [Pseudomonadota bacterium]
MLPIMSLFNRDKKNSDYEVYASPAPKPAQVQTPGALSNALRAAPKPPEPSQSPIYDRFKPPMKEVWHGPGTTVTIGEYSIANPLVYVGESLLGNDGVQTDPALIQPDLPLSKPLIERSAAIEPCYHLWSPGMRSAYLSWLATGRTAPRVPEIFLILFLYGIERRLLIDGPRDHFPVSEKLFLIQEMKRLAEIYPEHEHFCNGVKRLRAMDWAVSHDPNYAESFPRDIDFTSDVTKVVFPWCLACFAAQKKPMSDAWVLLWYMRQQENFNLPSIPESDAFGVLFKTRFNREYPEGFVVDPIGSKPLNIHYKAMNPALGVLDYPFGDVRDVFSNPRILMQFQGIVNECIDNYRAYDGYVAKADANEIGALIRLPIDLRLKNASIRRFGQFLNHAVGENAFALIDVSDLLSILGVPNQLNAQSADDLGTLIEMLGFQYAPKPQLHNQAITEHDKIVVTPSVKFPESSHAFSVMAYILRLGAVIAQCDEHVSQAEIDVLQNMVLKRKVLSDEQRTSLLLWLHWCLNTPQRIEDIHEDFEGVSDSLRDQISHVLVAVACADGVVTDDERERLRKVHRALNLPEAWLELEIGQLTTGKQSPSKPKADPRETSSSLFKKPQPEESVPSVGLSISNALSQSLANLCVIVPDPDIRPEFANAREVPQKKKPVALLDEAHLELLHLVMENTTFSRLDFFKSALEKNLMGDWVIKKINE